MSLDLSQALAQISDMAERLTEGRKEHAERLAHAIQTLGKADPEHLARKAASSRTTWLVAAPTEGLERSYPPPPCPPDYAAIATDGSHIDVDPHGAARCYLINIGSAVLRYGASPEAVLQSQPNLCADEEEMALLDPEGSREERVEGALLGVKRAVEECRALADLCRSPLAIPTIALLDGSLILWGLTGKALPDYVREAFLEKGLVKALDTLKEASKTRPLALASYISRPRSTEVVNLLRLALCPHEPANCDRFCPGPRPSTGSGQRPPKPRECDAVAGVQDRDLFAALLKAGERSATFASRSRIMSYYGEHEVRFFYLRLEDEVARVELPRWAAEDEGLLGLAHALVLDQCRRGRGYPAALAEAHEQAVLTGADREAFWHLVEAALAERGLPAATSAKSQAKRTRWI